jgi:hypothetical protein
MLIYKSQKSGIRMVIGLVKLPLKCNFIIHFRSTISFSIKIERVVVIQCIENLISDASFCLLKDKKSSFEEAICKTITEIG